MKTSVSVSVLVSEVELKLSTKEMCSVSTNCVQRKDSGGEGGGGIDFERRMKVWYQISQFTSTGCTV